MLRRDHRSVGALTRTLIVSDLHLGLPSGREALAEPRLRDALVERLAAADRVVLLGDLVELLEGPSARALAAARPLLERLGAAAREVVVVPGNHDAALVGPWLRGRSTALSLEEDVPAESCAELAAVVDALAPARVRVAYPGVWLRDDVYATHGHYLDAHLRPPLPLRLLWPRWREWLAPPAGEHATASDYERALTRAYAGIERVARKRHPPGAARLRRSLPTLAFLARGVTPGCDGAAKVSLALMTAKLRTGGLDAIGAVLDMLGVRAAHVVFGHVHRAGPTGGDDWRTESGTRLHNPGAWIRSGLVSDTSPYAPGHYVELSGDAPPALERLAR